MTDPSEGSNQIGEQGDPIRGGYLLAVIFALAVAGRVALCLHGGQYFLGDEDRYDRGIALYHALVGGDGAGVRAILSMPEHGLFPWVGAAVTAVQSVLARATPFGNWAGHPEYIGFTIGLGAAVLSLFSALPVLLVHRIARAMGANAEECLWAALLMSASGTGLLFARHLVPYDCSLCLWLAGLLIGLERPSPGRACAAGALAGFAYHLYNGYWFLIPTAVVLFALAWRSLPGPRRLATGFVLGSALGLALPLGAGVLAGGKEYFRIAGLFARTVKFGLFSEGGSLPWAFLWHSEGLLGVALVGVVIAAVATGWCRKRPMDPRTGLWLWGAALMYALWVLCSVLLKVFVIYGRTTKPLVPLACLAGAWALGRILQGRPTLKFMAAALIVGNGLLHFVVLQSLSYPREVEIAIVRACGNPKRSLSVSGSIYVPVAQAVARPDLDLVNAQYLFPIREYIGFPKGTTILQVSHALACPFYQYEGFSPRERAILRSKDISIRLIRLDDPARVPGDLPVSLRYRQSDLPTGR